MATDRAAGGAAGRTAGRAVVTTSVSHFDFVLVIN
jgi:acyl-CoA hydrolase